jgi:hypothetical protein
MTRGISPFVLGSIVVLFATMSAPRTASAEPAAASPPVRRTPLPETSFTYHEMAPYPTFAWAALQLIPSPELAFGRHHHVNEQGIIDRATSTAFGLRWQLSPVLWSFGVHRRQPRWRFFIVDPIARQSGSVELSTSFEYIGGHIDAVLVRPGVRVYLPVLDRGEYLSVSLGTSVYRYDGLRVAYDVGAYILSGFFGVQLTIAPTHAPLAAIATLRLRAF